MCKGIAHTEGSGWQMVPAKAEKLTASGVNIIAYTGSDGEMVVAMTVSGSTEQLAQELVDRWNAYLRLNRENNNLKSILSEIRSNITTALYPDIEPRFKALLIEPTSICNQSSYMSSNLVK